MITLREIIRSLYGAYRLARIDPSGLDFFETTVAGFWRSFFAAVIIAPFYLVLLMIRYADLSNQTPTFRFFAIETVAYVIAWLAFPVIMWKVAQAFDRSRHFLRFMVAYNWAAVLQNALYLPIVTLGTAGLLAAPTANALALLAVSLIVVYTWFITRTALDLGGGQAAGIVGLDFLISVFINAVAESRL
jgi:hypothetical protein